MIRRAGDRFRNVTDGVESWHSFSANGHYDPDNVGHGALIAVDEHVVAPGSGFDWHGHRGVAIVSWVASGRLRHEDDAGRVRVVGPEEVLVQRTGRGIRHCEVNASAREPLRLVQMTLVDGREQPSVVTNTMPVDLDGARLQVWHNGGVLSAPRWYAFVVDGRWQFGDDDVAAGDSIRGTDQLKLAGDGQALIWSLP